MNTLPKPALMPSCIVVEKPGRNLDSLVKNAAMDRLERTLLHEWDIRSAFSDVEQYGIRPTSMAIFSGPPGNGKTMSKLTGAPLYRVACEGLIHAYLGKTEQNMRELMDWLSAAGPAVVLFDECEALFKRRGSANDSCTQAVVRAMQVFWQPDSGYRRRVVEPLRTATCVRWTDDGTGVDGAVLLGGNASRTRRRRVGTCFAKGDRNTGSDQLPRIVAGHSVSRSSLDR